MNIKKYAKALVDAIKNFWEALKEAMANFFLFLNNVVKNTGVFMLVTSMVFAVLAFMFENNPTIAQIHEVTSVLFGLYILVWIIMNVDSEVARFLK